jgi:hypothetical protein
MVGADLDGILLATTNERCIHVNVVALPAADGGMV